MKHQALPLPMDIRLMNATATVLFMAWIAMLAAALGWWALRNPVFALRGITVQGDTAHNGVATLRANVTPRLAGNFFTVNLRKAREAFEAAPWVRDAIVQRQFPNRLRVILQEHQAEAFWGADSDSTLVNSYGEVFEANAGDVDQDDLPRLAGPDGSAPQVLAMYRALKPLFESLDLAIDELDLSGRGTWSLHLDGGATVELGRGTQDEVLVRTRRFVQTLRQVTSKYGRTPDALLSADLRHTDGYAVKLRGVATMAAQGN
jgi:cell division protein FtsQ